MYVIIAASLGEKIKNDDLYKEILISELIMALSSSTLNYTKQPFDECGKILSTLDKPKVSKMIMTKYEFNQVISLRTCQLSLGAVPFVDIKDEIKSNMDLRKIAIEELKQNKIPFLIKRPLPNNKYEYVRVRDLNMNAVKYMSDL